MRCPDLRPGLRLALAAVGAVLAACGGESATADATADIAVDVDLDDVADEILAPDTVLDVDPEVADSGPEVAPSTWSRACPEAVFAPGVMHTLNLEVTPERWEAIRRDPTCELEVPARFWMDDEASITVGVRRKSGFRLPAPEDPSEPTSYRCFDDEDARLPEPLPEKLPLKIDINEFVSGQRWHGLRKLSLENGGDASTLREGMAWELMQRAGVIASCAAWVRVVLNGEPLGVYLHVEQVDGTFLRSRLGDDIGALWKELEQDTCAGDNPDDAGSFGACVDAQRDRLCFAPFQEPGQTMCDGPPADTWPAALEPLVDLEQLLRMEAVDALIANNHSLFVGASNYWYFNPADGRPRVYLPWDLDTVMRLHAQGLGLATPQFEFHKLLLAHPVIGARFRAILEELFAGPFAEDELTRLLEDARTLLGAAVDEDDYLDLETSFDAHVDDVASWWRSRRAYVRAELDATR